MCIRDSCYIAWKKNLCRHYSITSKKSYSILEVAKRETNFSHQELVDILNPESMTEPS